MPEFSEPDMRRIARAVRWYERQAEFGAPARGATAPVSPQVEFVRVTSVTTTAGRYPGKVLAHDSSANTDTDLGDCWVTDENGGALVVSKYIGRRTGDANGQPVFRVCGTGTGGSGVSLPIGSNNVTFSGARAYLTSDQTIAQSGGSGPTVLYPINWDTNEFDTGGYRTGAASKFFAPVTGYYVVESWVYWSNNFSAVIGLAHRKNGGATVHELISSALGGAFSVWPQRCSSLIALTGGDYIEAVAASGSALNSRIYGKTALAGGYSGAGFGNLSAMWMYLLGT